MKEQTAKYRPAVILGRRGSVVRKRFSRAERERRRQMMIALNKERAARRQGGKAAD